MIEPQRHKEHEDDELNAVAADVFRYFDRREAADERKAQLKAWAWSILCWDGILPVAVVTIPSLLKVIAPNWKLGLALVCVFLPVVALSYRFVIGWARMRAGKSYAWQLIVFTLAISALFLFEAFILNDEIGGGPKIANLRALFVMFAMYVSMMSIALYPFQRVDALA